MNKKYAVLVYDDKTFGCDFLYSDNCLLLELEHYDEKKHDVYGTVIDAKKGLNIILQEQIDEEDYITLTNYDKYPFGRYSEVYFFDDIIKAKQRFMLEIL